MNILDPNFTFDETGLVDNQKWFYHWIVERERARSGYEGRIPKPWTNDHILQTYRFCNVRREDDSVSKWINENWMKEYDDCTSPQRMVFAMCVARLFNRPSTLKLIGFPHEDVIMSEWFDHTRVVLKNARARGEKIWTGAYLVSTNGAKQDKIDYILDRVLTPIFRFVREPYERESLQEYHNHLTSFDGLGSFMAGQVIADLKYTSVLSDAPDWWTWAPIGPGSKRGLNRYFRRKLEANIKDSQVIEELGGVQLQVQQRLGILLPVHNIQNCMCEYDKYLRCKFKEGTPRSRYNGHTN